MALTTPTTAQIAANIIVQLEASLSQQIPLLPKAFSRVLAKVLSAQYVILYKYAGFSLLQQFVSTATLEETEVNGVRLRPLVEWGRMIGVGDPLAATQAELDVEVTLLTPGGYVPGGAQLLHVPTGVVYQTVAPVPAPIHGTLVTVVARATSDQAGGDGSGTVGNLEPGQTLQFASPLPGLVTEASVTGVSVVGADGETEDVYRARVLRRFQRRAQGGAYADYRMWGLEVPGIKNIFPYTGSNPGEIDVYVEAVADVDGIPEEPQLAQVLDAINYDADEAPAPTGLANRRPVNAAVNVLPVTRTAFDVAISGLETEDVTTVRDAMEQGLDEFLRAREPYIVGLSTLPRLDRVTQGAVAGVVNEIAEANGASVASVTLIRDGVTILQYTLAHGELAKLGSLIPT